MKLNIADKVIFVLVHNYKRIFMVYWAQKIDETELASVTAGV